MLYHIGIQRKQLLKQIIQLSFQPQRLFVVKFHNPQTLFLHQTQ